MATGSEGISKTEDGEDRATATGPPGVDRWASLELWLKRAEMIAKPLAFILAVAGLVGLYQPKARRWYEEIVMPTARYQVGKIWKSADQTRVILSPASYDSPAWNGNLNAEALMGLVGSDVLTTDTAVGRGDYSLYSQVLAVQEKNQCLHVTDVAFADYIPEARSWQPMRLRDVPTGATAAARVDLLVAAARNRGARNCQMLTAKERSDREKARTLPKGYPAFDDAVEICPRTLVWIKAQKVSC